MTLNNIRTFDGSFLEPLASCSNGCIEYFGKEVKLENLPWVLIADMVDDFYIDEYGCLKNPVDFEIQQKKLTHDAYIIYDVWFDDGITINNMQTTLEMIEEINKVINGNENIDKESIEISENEYVNTCLDFKYCVKFNFMDSK